LTHIAALNPVGMEAVRRVFSGQSPMPQKLIRRATLESTIQTLDLYPGGIAATEQGTAE
jgi:hypothetical protein